MPSSFPTYSSSVRPFIPGFSRMTQEINDNFILWKKQFPTLDLEVGCGNGFHPIQRAKAFPNRGLIAVERTRDKGDGLRRRLQTHPRIKNIFPLYGEAAELLPFLLEAQSISKLFLMYPNPYPKKSQRNKRWHFSSLLHFLIYSLQSEGKIEMRTNELWLAKEAQLNFTQLWNLSLTKEIQLLGEQQSYATHFEKKYLLRGETCFQLVFQNTHA